MKSRPGPFDWHQSEVVDRLVTIQTTTLEKNVTFRASLVEYIAETNEGTTVHLCSGKHLTIAADFNYVKDLIWPKEYK